MSDFKSDSSVSRILKNAGTGACRFAVFALSGFFFIPFLVRQYGSGSYGLIALAGFLTQYVGLVSGCVGASVSRFMNIALNKNDWKQANEIFSTALFANVVVILLQIPVFAFAVWKLNWVIDFPPARALDFRILVICNLGVFFISILKGVFFTPVYAANRLDIGDKFCICTLILRIILLLVLINTVGPYLWIIGAVDLGLAILNGCVSLLLYRRLVGHQLTFRKKHITRKWVKPVLNMAGWGVVATLGQALFQKTDVWIINRFVDIELAGICAALLLWPNFVQQIAKNFSSLIMPVFMIDYANNRIDRIRSAALLLSKAYAIMSLLILGFTMLLGEWFLDVWMGPAYGRYHGFLILMLLHFPLTLSREAIWAVFPAFDKMQYVGIANLSSGVLNIALSLLAVYWGFGLAGVIVATGTSLIIQRTWLLSRSAAKLLGFSYRAFIRIYSPGVLVLAGYGFQWMFLSNAYVRLVGLISIGLAVHYGFQVVFRDAAFKALQHSILMALGRRPEPAGNVQTQE